jgi:hypothetical protein
MTEYLYEGDYLEYQIYTEPVYDDCLFYDNYDIEFYIENIFYFDFVDDNDNRYMNNIGQDDRSTLENIIHRFISTLNIRRGITREIDVKIDNSLQDIEIQIKYITESYEDKINGIQYIDKQDLDTITSKFNTEKKEMERLFYTKTISDLDKEIKLNEQIVYSDNYFTDKLDEFQDLLDKNTINEGEYLNLTKELQEKYKYKRKNHLPIHIEDDIYYHDYLNHY